MQRREKEKMVFVCDGSGGLKKREEKLNFRILTHPREASGGEGSRLRTDDAPDLQRPIRKSSVRLTPAAS